MSSAEAIVTLSPMGLAAAMASDVLATARIAGVMAAKHVPDLIPLRQEGGAAEMTFAASADSIRITASGDSAIAVMTAVSVAALTLYDMAGDAAAVIGAIRLTDSEKNKELPRRSAGTRDIAPRGQSDRSAAPRARAKPEVLMGEVAAPRAAPDSRREAFRNFMTSKRLRPTTWARDAGVATGEILGFLTGRSRGFSGEVAEKLARAARVSVEDMFR